MECFVPLQLFTHPLSSYAFNEMYAGTIAMQPAECFSKLKFFETADEDDRTIMIIPLYGFSRRYYLIGDLLMTGYLDCIYGHDICDEDFAASFALLQPQLAGTKLSLNKLSERSRLHDYLQKHYTATEKQICVRIDFGDAYEAYFKSLSKHVRQNIRTTYNRLVAKGLAWGLETR